MLTKYKSGQSVVEVIVAVAIFVIIAGGSVGTVLSSFLGSRLAEEESKALYLSEEGLTATESIRNQSFQNLTDGNHGLTKGGGFWSFNGTSESIGKFTRRVVVLPTSRDASGNIVTTGGTADPNTKRVISQVTWNFTPGSNSTVEMTKYFTNWLTSNSNPAPISCNQACVVGAYSSGICRGTVNQCNQNGETNLGSANALCTGGGNSDTCCCRP